MGLSPSLFGTFPKKMYKFHLTRAKVFFFFFFVAQREDNSQMFTSCSYSSNLQGPVGNRKRERESTALVWNVNHYCLEKKKSLWMCNRCFSSSLLFTGRWFWPFKWWSPEAPRSACTVAPPHYILITVPLCYSSLLVQGTRCSEMT